MPSQLGARMKLARAELGQAHPPPIPLSLRPQPDPWSL